MSEQNDVILTHIEYIRSSVDELKSDMKAVATQSNDHEKRITILEERTPAKSRSGFWGTSGFLAGLLAGLGLKS